MSQCKQCSCTASTITGKVALVTGSSDRNGIGVGIARSLASRGCPVILTGRRDSEKVEQLRTELESEYKVPVHYFQADFCGLNDVQELVTGIYEIYQNGVDILVNNAVMHTVRSPVEELDISIWEKSLRVNLTAPFCLIQMILPGMKRKGWGRIINMSSIWGLGGKPLGAGHVTSKHGVIGLTKSVALETAGSGVTCNAICPGYVRTEMLKNLLTETAEAKGISFEECEADYLPTVNASGKYVEVEQIGELAAFLCSPAADQMTGTSVSIDAGNRAR